MGQQSTSSQRILWIAFAIALVAMGAYSLISHLSSSPKEVAGLEANGKEIPVALVSADTSGPIDYGYVPSFSLTNQFNKPFNQDSLKGSVWVADLIFTSCGGTCPIITSKMASLQKRIATYNDVKLVSVSVDPNTDKPTVLAKYAKEHNADTKQWSFLTGPVHTVYTLAKEGFHLAVDSAHEDLNAPLTHSEKFVLVDKSGHIEKYYNGTSDEEIDQLVKDIEELRKR